MVTVLKNKVTLTFINEYACLFSGLSQDHYEYFYNKYGFLTDKHFFHPLFKLGKWDGKKRFFTMNGLTAIHLAKEILEKLENFGYSNFNVVDKRANFELDFQIVEKDYFIQKEIELGDHQVAAINALLQNYGGVIRAGTGAGKTIITAVLCDCLNNQNMRTIIIVPSYDLVVQTIRTFKRCGLDVGEYSGKLKDIDHQNVICTWQALKNNPDVLKLFKSLILDELHTLNGAELQKIVSEHAAHIPIKFGMTGTIPEDECARMVIKSCFGDVHYEISAGELIELGWLAKINIECIELEEDFTPQYKQFLEENADSKISYNQFVVGFFPDYTAEVSYLLNNGNRNFVLCERIRKISQSGNTLIILNSIKHGKRLEAELEGSVFISGSTKSKDRQKVYDSYAESDNLIHISTYKLVQAGLDIPRLRNLVIIDAGKSYIRVIQSLGRSLRKAHDKDEAFMYDIHSNLKYSTQHYKKRIGFYKKEKYPFKNIKIKLKPWTGSNNSYEEDVDFD